MRWRGKARQIYPWWLQVNRQQAKAELARKWFSPPDASLSFSLALRPPQFVSAQSDANILLLRHTALGALAVCDTLQTYYQLSPQIKWPNDVLLDGKKVCGVLAEAQWLGDQLESIILGIGLNIHSKAVPPENELAFPATCIQDYLQVSIPRHELLQQILEKLLYWRYQIGNPAFIQAWEKRLAFRHSWVSVFNRDRQLVKSFRRRKDCWTGRRWPLDSGESTGSTAFHRVWGVASKTGIKDVLMLEDFRQQANASFLEEPELEEKIPEAASKPASGKKFLGLTPVQRLSVALMLLTLTCLLGSLLLLVTEKVVPSFIF